MEFNSGFKGLNTQRPTCMGGHNASVGCMWWERGCTCPSPLVAGWCTVNTSHTILLLHCLLCTTFHLKSHLESCRQKHQLNDIWLNAIQDIYYTTSTQISAEATCLNTAIFILWQKIDNYTCILNWQIEFLPEFDQHIYRPYSTIHHSK